MKTNSTHTLETKRKMSETHSRIGSGSRLIHGHGEANTNWKGSAASYSAIHKWLARNLPKTGTCAECQVHVGVRRPNGTEYANISGEYRRDLSDYRELCKTCHAAERGSATRYAF